MSGLPSTRLTQIYSVRRNGRVTDYSPALLWTVPGEYGSRQRSQCPTSASRDGCACAVPDAHRCRFRVTIARVGRFCLGPRPRTGAASTRRRARNAKIRIRAKCGRRRDGLPGRGTPRSSFSTTTVSTHQPANAHSAREDRASEAIDHWTCDWGARRRSARRRAVGARRRAVKRVTLI